MKRGGGSRDPSRNTVTALSGVRSVRPGAPAWAQGPGRCRGCRQKTAGGEVAGGWQAQLRNTPLMDTRSWIRVDLGLERKAQG